ncbi:unnamed protein product [Mytilus edulis]|uniref:Uncharacterized protein n=1 Tax=Mytilus edulis TaxID=6550 RepID=A0A8S3TRF7_MYTED|nr:unnamed protein product [Mytilus edulis]
MMESNAGNQNMEEDIVELLTRIDHRLGVIEGRTDKIESIDRKLGELTKLTEAKRDINELKGASNAANKVNVSDLREKILDLQCRSMQNNLVFSGIEEKPEEDTKIVIQNFISNELSIKKDIQFGNIHRFGRADKNKGKPRLIVVKFVYFADLRKVLEAGPKLKEKPQFGMNLQFPIEIEERRRKLYPVMKDAKRNGKRVSLIRDKLIIEGKVYYSKNNIEESQTSPKENNDTVSVCRRCIESHKNELQIGTHMKEELREICSFLENATDRIDTVENVTGTIELVTGNGENEEDNNSEACSAISNTEFAADGKLEDIMMDTAMSMDSEPDLFSSQTISQATATSSWSRDERSQKEIFNWAMEVMSNGQYPTLKSQASIKFEELQYSTKMYYIRQARSAFEIVCENIAPSQGLELMTQVCHSMKLKTSESKQKDALTETIISAYNKAEDHTTKVQVLSLIVEKYSKSELLSFIQGMTIYKIDAARKYAATHGPGQYVTPPKITRIRLPKQKLHHFIEFISSPCYLQVVGFGSRHLKLSSGLVVKVPKVIRTMIASRLINAYTNYCKENSIIPPCRATQFKIIKACAASQLKSLHGLDNYISDGMDSIDTLKKVVSNLGTNGMITSKVDDLNESLDTLKLHLKNEFQNHLSSESDCNEHCIHLALSEKGCEHVHTTTCQPCSRMYQIKDELQNLMTSNFPDINSKEKEEFEHDISVSTEKIWAWRII